MRRVKKSQSMRRLFCICMAFLLLLSACAKPNNREVIDAPKPAKKPLAVSLEDLEAKAAELDFIKFNLDAIPTEQKLSMHHISAEGETWAFADFRSDLNGAVETMAFDFDLNKAIGVTDAKAQMQEIISQFINLSQAKDDSNEASAWFVERLPRFQPMEVINYVSNAVVYRFVINEEGHYNLVIYVGE